MAPQHLGTSWPMALVAGVALSGIATASAAECFDRTLAVARYHYVNPGNVANNWKEIYEIALKDGAVETVTRLTKGAVSLPRYDSAFMTYTGDGSRIVYVESDDGGTNGRLKVMDAVDLDGDLEGDNATVLDASGVDITTVARGPNDLLVYGKFDANDDTQIASATLTGTTLGPVTVHTSGSAYPDSFSFVTAMEVIYSSDFRDLVHLDLGTGAVTTLLGGPQIDRTPTGTVAGDAVYFTRVVGNTLDLWQATLGAGPSLGAVSAFLTTTGYNEVEVELSEDGRCLAYLAGDLAINYGPNADLWVRDLVTGETQQITSTRDLAGMAWKP